MQFAVRSITNKSFNTGLGRGCFNVLLILLASVARIDGRINRRCTFGGFSSIVNAALKRILQEYVLLLRNSSKLGINHYFLDQRKTRTYHLANWI